MAKISASEIKTMATTVKTYVEKNKKFPTSVTVNSKKYNYGQVAYILCYAVNNIGKSLDVITVGNASSPTGDTINENIYKSDYTYIAKSTFEWIKKNKQCPNYATTKKSKKKLRPRVFIYMMARIIVFYYNNKNTMPNYVNANSSYYNNSSGGKGLKPYLTNHGCSGMGQCTGYYCACNALQQCFYRLTGILVSESAIASAAGTTSSGTGHGGINTAVAWFNKKYGKNVKITWKNFSEVGWSGMQKAIDKGAVFNHILYRDTWGHYEVPKQISGDNVIVLNSLGDSCGSGTYCGYIETRSKSTHRRYINGISQKSVAILTNG